MWAAPAAADSANITDADVALRLAPNGDLLVTETLRFDYQGHFEGSYRDIDLLHGERISDVSVSQDGVRFQPGGDTTLGSHDRPEVFGATSTQTGARIVWHYNATDDQRTTVVSYRVRNAVVAYDDVLDIGWTVWGSQWDFDLDHLTASFTNPLLNRDDPLYRVWGHPRDVEGHTVRGEGRATLEADNVNSNTAVEFRVTMPRDPTLPYPGARQAQGDGLPKILAEEQALDDDFNSFWNRTKRFIADHALLLALAIAGLAALALFVLDLLARERDVGVPEYLPEPPDDATPALAYGLAHEGGDSTNTVLATLLDLVDRGYYESSEATTDDEKLDLALKQKPDDQRPPDTLQPYELDVMSFFDQLLDGETVPLSDMKDKVPKHSEVWRGRWERMTEKLDAAESGELAWDRDLRWARSLVAAVAAALFGVVILCDLAVNEEWLAPTVIGALTLIGIFAVPGRRFRRLDAVHRERAARWESFARWTADFPRLSDDPPATLALWKRILVFGVAFGTAERMISSGRIPEPVVASATGGGAVWYAYAFTGGFDGSSFDGSSFSSSFASQVAPESSSSGGGGGFSGGGGGGFSGGGGGGSW